MEPPLARLEYDVVAGAPYGLRVALMVEAAGQGAPVVLAVTYLDRQGRLLDKGGPGLLPSAQFGHYRHLGRPGTTGPIAEHLQLVPPRGAVRAWISLHDWQGSKVSMTAAPRMALLPMGAQTTDQTALVETRLLAAAEGRVPPGDGVQITANYASDRDVTDRALLATIQVFDADGAVLELGAEVPVSGTVGPFRYLRPDTAEACSGSARFGLSLPPGAHRIAVQVLRWVQDPSLRVTDVTIAPSAGPVLASGELATSGSTRFQFSARLRTPAWAGDGPPPLLELECLDAGDAPIEAGVDGTQRRDGLWSHLALSGPVQHGEMRVMQVLRLPEGAIRLRWRLRAPLTDSDPPTSLTRAPQITPLDRPKGPADLPEALSDAITTGQMRVLGEAKAAVHGRWLRVTGRADGALRFLPLVPVAQGGWVAPAGPGLVPGPVGCHWAEPLPRPNGQTRFEGVLFLPPRIREVRVIALADLDGATSCEDLTLHPARADDIRLDSDPAGMSSTALTAAIPLAQVLGDLPAEAALRRALAADEDTPRGQRAEARRLRARVALIDGHWRPDPAPAPLSRRDPEAVLCIAPRDQGEATRRQTALMQARRGPCHWVSALPDAPTGAGADGLIRQEDGRITWHDARFAALDPDQMLETDRLNLQVRLWQRVLAASGARIIQASDSASGTELALAGLALAQAHDLPFVYDRTGFTAQLWRDPDPDRAALQSSRVTRMRLAQEARLMAGADMVLVPGEAFRDRLRRRGVPAGRIAVVPQGASDAALRPVAALPPPALSGLPGGMTRVGVICGPDHPGAAELALAALAEHPAADRHLLILLDASSSPDPARAVATGPLGNAGYCGWLDACDLILAPSRADLRSDWTPPARILDAMARRRPVIIADRPYAAELAGADQDRALVASSDDPGALCRAWQASQGDAQGSLARLTRAQAWVRTRSWARAAQALTQAYTDARALRRTGAPR